MRSFFRSVALAVVVLGCGSEAPSSVFGFTDRYGWDELGDATPLVFDKDYRVKPAFFSLQSGLARK